MANTCSPKTLVILLVTLMCAYSHGAFSAQNDRVLLKEVEVLTLYKDRHTAGRRSSPVPQLTCVGGSAKGYFTPSVVQCYNRGSDGYDVQWECKTDMDNAYRFGSVEVTCEGYDYPEDPYILKGSCGLEYSLEFTEEGYQRYKQHQSQHHSGAQYTHQQDNHVSWDKKGKSIVGDLIFLGGVALVIYVIYKSCLSSAANDDHSPPRNTRSDQPPPYSPPPYGFRDEYMPGDSCSGSASYTGNTYTGTRFGTGANQGGGFWTGAATGGFLGYLFGRNNGYGGYTQYQQPYSPYGSTYATPRNTGGWFSGWGSGGGGRTTYSSSSGVGGGWGASSSSSTGTRTASGFGGTKRR